MTRGQLGYNREDMKFRLLFPGLLLSLALPGAPPARADAPSVETLNILEVDSLRGISGFFNLAQGTVRVFAIVSPTSPECAATIDSVASVLERYPTRRLRAYIVFVPVVEGDSRVAALERAAPLADRRLLFFYNDNRALESVFQAVAGTDAPTWNGLFLYDTDATFDDSPGSPVDSILPSDGDGRAQLESGLLSRRSGELLAAFEAKRRDAQKTTN